MSSIVRKQYPCLGNIPKSSVCADTENYVMFCEGVLTTYPTLTSCKQRRASPLTHILLYTDISCSNVLFNKYRLTTWPALITLFQQRQRFLWPESYGIVIYTDCCSDDLFNIATDSRTVRKAIEISAAAFWYWLRISRTSPILRTRGGPFICGCLL